MPKFTILLQIDADDRRDAEAFAEGLADYAEGSILMVAASANLEAAETLR